MTKTQLSLTEARNIALKIIYELKPFCERVEIAGSIRRGKPEIGDIEIVAIPKMIPMTDMFDLLYGEESVLDLFDYSTIGRVIMGKSKYKKIETKWNITLDLFIVTPPAQWGVLFMIRTGSEEFSHKMVMVKRYGGHLPSDCKVKDGAVWRNGKMIPMDDERDYFSLCGIEYIEPEKRQ